MVNLDATTPQLKVLKQWADAHHSRDLNDAAPIFSKDFTLKMFPKSTVFPDLTREEYLQKYTVAFSLFTNVDVSALKPWTTFECPADVYNPQVVFHEVIEAPGKIVAHVCPLSTPSPNLSS